MFQISLHDLCRRILARSTSATNFVYFENGCHESSSSGAPLRTVALHDAMYDTVHRVLINRYTHNFKACVAMHGASFELDRSGRELDGLFN